MKHRSTKLFSALKPRSAKGKGVLVLLCLLAFALYSFNQAQILTTLSSGQHLNADFATGYKLTPYSSNVKIAGVKVGVVTGLKPSPSGGQEVSMKLDNGTLAKLGSAPSASIRPTTLLGGIYYVELVPGGLTGAVAGGSIIPVGRTTVPVELDKVLSTITRSASASIQGTVSSLQATLLQGGNKQVARLLDNGPKTLAPASTVLGALQGTRPGQDLNILVQSTENLSAALTRQQGQLGSIIDGLAATSAALAATRTAMASTIAAGPATLSVTRQGLGNLDSTLEQLQVTATSFRPSARALDDVLGQLGPVLKSARPVIANTRTVSADALPLVQNLVPTASLAIGVLHDFNGPVLDRLHGPIAAAVLAPWHGTGKYDGGGNAHPLYKELGYLFSNTADVFKFHDNNGASGRLMAGVGVSSAGGLVDHSLLQYLQALGFDLPAGPHEGANPGEPSGLNVPNLSPTVPPTTTLGGLLGQLLGQPSASGSAK